MRKLSQISELSRLSTNEMRITRGGEKQIIKCELRSNGYGSYYRIYYSDGTVDNVSVALYA